MYYSRYLKADKDYVKSLKLHKNNFKDFHNFKHRKTNQRECFIIYSEKTSNRYYYYFSNLAWFSNRFKSWFQMITNIIGALIFGIIIPIILIITLYYDEKQFKKELKEKYDKTEWKNGLIFKPISI